jgi:hypothetical protein
MMPDLTPLPLTDEDLDRLSEIAEQDIILTQAFVMKHIDPKYKNLLLAMSQELAELEESSE